MEIRTVLKKGTEHLVNCEDDLSFVQFQNHSEEVTIGAVFDGCSTGYKSHFASTLFGKILHETLNSGIEGLFTSGETLEEMGKYTFNRFFFILKQISNILSLRDLEIVSTFIIAFVKENEAYFIVSGDGCIMVDNEEIKLESDNNAPDYLAYHLEENVNDVYEKNIKKFKFNSFEKSISICSDGIYSFRKPGEEKLDVDNKIIETLLLDDKLMGSDAMLARKYNILMKEGYSNYDDLSIVRFIKSGV